MMAPNPGKVEEFDLILQLNCRNKGWSAKLGIILLYLIRPDFTTLSSRLQNIDPVFRVKITLGKAAFQKPDKKARVGFYQ